MTTRQIVFPSANEVDVRIRETPQPGRGEVILRVRRVGICATDLHVLAGHIGDPFPMVPGHEFVGEVHSVGPDSARLPALAVGARIAVEMLLPCRSCARCREGRYNLCDRDDPSTVTGAGRQYGINIPQTIAPGLWGGYADHLIVPPEAIVHRLPDTIPWNTAVLVEPLAVAFRAVGRGRVTAGDTVAIVGPGPVGLLTAAAAVLSGAQQVVVVGTRPERLARARQFGADHTVDVRTTVDVASEVAALLGRRPDVVIETAGAAAAQIQAVRMVRRGGRVVLAGACGAAAPVTFLADEDLLTREIDILPSFLSAGGYEPAIAALERNSFPFGDLVTHTFALEEVEEALEVVRSKVDGVMKAVLVIDK